ncbi:unnamed protein product [Amaranthus hypochondriacus]
MMSKKVRERDGAKHAVKKHDNGDTFYNGEHRGRFRRPNWTDGPSTPQPLPQRQVLDPRRRPRSREVVSLFIDGIPRNVVWGELKNLFSEMGDVVDLYVSKKQRKNMDGVFGFVRYQKAQEAERAIATLDGKTVGGSKISVAHARYQRGGMVASPPVRPNPIRRPAFRDTRRYADVVKGTHSNHGKVEEGKNIPISLSLRVVEQEGVINLESAMANIKDANIPVVSSYSLSPTKMILFFESEQDIVEVMDFASPLWTMFDDVRRWTEGETYSDRILWLDCFGIHPQCWNDETIRMIGEKWGPVLKIEREVQGVSSISYARMMVRTHAQNKVDARIRLTWETGACEVWVKEAPICAYKNEVAGVRCEFWARDVQRLSMEGKLATEKEEAVEGDWVENPDTEQLSDGAVEGERVENPDTEQLSDGDDEWRWAGIKQQEVARE